MSGKKIFKYLLPDFIYGIVTIIFLFLLNGLNEVLLVEQFAGKNDLELLMYNNYQPIKYFSISLVLTLIGEGRIVYLGYHAKEREKLFEEIIAMFISILIILNPDYIFDYLY